MIQRILVWDTPTRLFHWLQALSFAGAYLTADTERYRDIHVALGYIMLGLIAFRLLWGFIGTRYALFRSFFFTPKEIVAYLLSLVKGNPKHYVGHTPVGSMSIWLMLALGIIVCVTGVIALQDDASDAVVDMHEIATYVMLAMILLHLIGVVMSSVMHRENLVRAMITGFKYADLDKGIARSYNWLGVMMIVMIVVFWIVFIR